jgi:hypothetical protein
MLSTKNRIKLLSKIAQLGSAPQSTTNNPTTPQSTPAASTTISPPPTFIASQIYGWLPGQYNTNSINYINGLISLLNTALHYSSNGQYNFQELRNDNFQIDPSGAPSIDTKNLLNLSILIYKTFLNSGNQFPTKPTPQQIQNWGKLIGSSQAFLNLSQLNPSGPIAQKIPGNMKDNILNYIRYLDMYNSIS